MTGQAGLGGGALPQNSMRYWAHEQFDVSAPQFVPRGLETPKFWPTGATPLHDGTGDISDQDLAEYARRSLFIYFYQLVDTFNKGPRNLYLRDIKNLMGQTGSIGPD
jgi:hypothetical protein